MIRTFLWDGAIPSTWVNSTANFQDNSILHRPSNFPHMLADLKDFYYFFRAQARAHRNVLVAPLHPKEVAHLRSFRGELMASPHVYGCLNTLAMGDTQAVELAQACHIGIGTQYQVVDESNLLCLQKPIPRTSDVVGLVIEQGCVY